MIELLAIAGIVGALAGVALGASIVSRTQRGLPAVEMPRLTTPKPPEPVPDVPVPPDPRIAF